ncbi:MAG TPA: hypothetical protein VMU51_05320 [Mycobacteriales bacterium]|nr:hypothetical protein [Mycobacteriales bacterium]
MTTEGDGEPDPFGTAVIRQRVLASWAASPARFREDANAEEDLVHGAYRDRLLIELAQNAADAAARAGSPGRLRLSVVDGELRAANTGAPLDAAGVEALATLRASAKRDAGAASVGRFGVGFAAVLAVSDAPAVRSTTGGLRFSAAWTLAEVRAVPTLSTEVGRRDGHVPVLRLPWPAPAGPPAGYATEVRLPLRPGVEPDVLAALADLDPTLLLALPALASVDVAGRVLSRVDGPGGLVRLAAGDAEQSWRVWTATGTLPAELLANRPVEDRERPEWTVTWAVPVGPGGAVRPLPGRQVLHAPTPSDEPVSLPARLIATFPSGPDRRHVAPGPITDLLIDRAAAGYAGMMADLPATPALLDLVPRPTLAGAELDSALGHAILTALRAIRWLPTVSPPDDDADSWATEPAGGPAADPPAGAAPSGGGADQAGATESFGAALAAAEPADAGGAASGAGQAAAPDAAVAAGTTSPAGPVPVGADAASGAAAGLAAAGSAAAGAAAGSAADADPWGAALAEVGLVPAGAGSMPAAAVPVGRVAPPDAVVVDGATEALLAPLTVLLPGLLPAGWSGPAHRAALRAVGVRRLSTADIVALVSGVDRPATWWRTLYAGLAEAADREALAALPVPLADGRMVTGVRGVLLPDPALPADAASALGLRVVHPDAAHPLLERLGAVPATAAGVLADERVRAAVATSIEEDDPEPVAEAVLALVAAAELAPGELPWLAELALPGADGDWYPAGELLLPGSALAEVVDPDAPFGRVEADLVADWGADVLRAVGVLTTFAVLRAPDVEVGLTDADSGHDLDGEDDWYDAVADLLPPQPAPPRLVELVAVRDLEFVHADRWGQALPLLAALPGVAVPAVALLADGGRAEVLPYTRWWLASHPVLGGHRPDRLRLPAATDLAGLYDLAAGDPAPLDPALLDFAGCLHGLADLLADPERAADLLDRLGDPARTVPARTLREVYARLAFALDGCDVPPPARVRVAPDRVAARDAVAVLDQPHLLPLLGHAVIPAGDAPGAVADLLDVPFASDLVRGTVVSAPTTRRRWADIPGADLAAERCGADVPDTDVAVHDHLLVTGSAGTGSAGSGMAGSAGTGATGSAGTGVAGSAGSGVSGSAGGPAGSGSAAGSGGSAGVAGSGGGAGVAGSAGTGVAGSAGGPAGSGGAAGSGGSAGVTGSGGGAGVAGSGGEAGSGGVAGVAGDGAVVAAGDGAAGSDGVAGSGGTGSSGGAVGADPDAGRTAGSGSGRPDAVPVPWWPGDADTPDAVDRAGGPDALGRALAWRLGRWDRRAAAAEAFAHPEDAARLRAEDATNA